MDAQKIVSDALKACLDAQLALLDYIEGNSENINVDVLDELYSDYRAAFDRVNR